MLLSALWLGILTSISPCPLASNIAAISFISKEIKNEKRIFLQGILYILGRSIVYVILAFLIVKALVNTPSVSSFLQTYMSRIIGILLIVVGMFLLDLIKFNIPGMSLSRGFQNKFKNAGPAESFLLGALFALAFCPISAALFFGSLIPLAVKAKSALLFPAAYGLGTGLPVVVFALIIAFAAHKLGKFYHNITKVEFWAKRITGVIFILAGVYYVLAYVFEII